MTTTEATAEAARIMTRLKAQYAARTLLPSGAALTLNQLQRLYRAVVGEFVE